MLFYLNMGIYGVSTKKTKHDYWVCIWYRFGYLIVLAWARHVHENKEFLCVWVEHLTFET